MNYNESMHVIRKPDSYWRELAKHCPSAWWAKELAAKDTGQPAPDHREQLERIRQLRGT